MGLLAALVAAACRGPEEPGETRRPLTLDSVRLGPVVTRPGEGFTLSLHVTGAQSPRIHAHPAEQLDVRRDGALLDSLVLYDDATNGDLAAGDGWFTLDGLVLPPTGHGVAATTLSEFSALHQPAAPHADSFLLRVSFRTADPATVGSPVVTLLAPDARATSRVVALLDPDARDLGEPTLERIVRRYYELFADDRDLLVVVVVPPTVGDLWSARAYQMGNQVAGLGLGTAEWRDFGSAGRLRLVVHSRMDVYTGRDGAGSFCLLNHELTHRWAAYVGQPLADGAGHWRTGALARDTSALGDPYGCRFNDLELYLAGLLPADSVKDPLGRDGYTMAALVAAQGPRRPAYGKAPANFTLGFVVAYDVALSDHELAYFHYLAGEYTAAASALAINWSEATGGRSRLTPEITPLAGASWVRPRQ